MVAVEEPALLDVLEPPAPGAEVVAHYLALPETLRGEFRAMIRRGLEDSNAILRIQADRELYRARWETLVVRAESFAAYASAANLPDAVALSAAAAEIRAFVADLFPRWQTVGDINGILCAAITPPAEELRKKLAKLPGPPQWWWEMDHKKPW